MKTYCSRLMREETGKVLIMVLILLVVGGLILTPLLGLMQTGLIAGQVYERKLHEYYAADAGIEDALWKIRHGIQPPDEGYGLTVNGVDVWVEVESKDTTQFLVELLDAQDQTSPHSDWMVVGSIPESGEAIIEITWEGEGEAFLTDVGMWIRPAGESAEKYSYAEEQPELSDDDVRTQNARYDLALKEAEGGTAFIWTWTNASVAQGPSFCEDYPTRTLTFHFSPAEPDPDRTIAFTMAGRKDVGLSHDGGYENHTITAVATTDAASETTVVAGAARRGCDGSEIVIFSWNIS